MFVLNASIICLNVNIYAAERIQETKFLSEINVKLKLDGFPDQITLLKNFKPFTMHYNNIIYTNTHNDVVTFIFDLNNNISKITMKINQQPEVEVIPFIKSSDTKITFFQVNEKITEYQYSFIEVILSNVGPIFNYNENLLVSNHMVQCLDNEINFNNKRKETFNKKAISLIDMPKNDFSEMPTFNNKLTSTSLVPSQKSMEEVGNSFFKKKISRKLTFNPTEFNNNISTIKEQRKLSNKSKCGNVFSSIIGFFIHQKMLIKI